MRIRSLVLAVLAAVLTLPIAAQSVAGRWNATVDSEFGPFSFVFELLVDAAGKLAGTMHSDFFDAPIKDATVNGSDIAFKLSIDTPDGAINLSYTGTVKGDELALTAKVEGAPAGTPDQSFTAHRAQ